jgi:hypothetical protein
MLDKAYASSLWPLFIVSTIFATYAQHSFKTMAVEPTFWHIVEPVAPSGKKGKVRCYETNIHVDMRCYGANNVLMVQPIPTKRNPPHTLCLHPPRRYNFHRLPNQTIPTAANKHETVDTQKVNSKHVVP